MESAGKTTTVVEYIRQEVVRGKRVLACAPSNVAVDNIAERLAAEKVRVVRLGHPARLLESVVALSLDMQVLASDSKQLANDARKEMNSILKKLNGPVPKTERCQLRSELATLRKEVWNGCKTHIHTQTAASVQSLLREPASKTDEAIFFRHTPW
jgi:hypothetical protein